jgi:hypothetical protein
MSEMANTIKGEEGSKVTIEVLRGEQILTFEVTREKVNTNPVYSEKLENDIGYLEITSFDEGVAEDFKAKYKNSPYMPFVDTMNSRLFMAKASMDKEIADLYDRRDKELGTAFYMEKVKKSWVNPEEIEPVKVPWYRAMFE